MPKILMVTTVSVTLEAFLLPYAEELEKEGWQVDCLANGASQSKKCKKAFNRCYDIDWGRSPLAIKNLTAYPKQIKELIRREKYDIVHVHTPVASFVTRLALRNLRKQTKTRVIYTAHGFHFYRGGNPIKNAIFMAVEKLASYWTDHLVVINEEDYRSAIRYLLPRKQVTWIKGGVGLDTKYYNPDSVSRDKIKEVRESLNVEEGDVLFTMIAEFNPGKRHTDLIQAFSMLKDDRVHLALLGKGPLLKEIKDTCRKLGMGKRIHFTGQISDVRPYILASRATILTSEREGLPRSVMESMALGVPVIGADARGTRDLLKEKNDFIFQTGDVKRLSKIMDNLARNNKHCNFNNSTNKIIKNINLKNTISIHKKLYDSSRIIVIYGGFISRGGGVVRHVRELSQAFEKKSINCDIFSMESICIPVRYTIPLIERTLNLFAAPVGTQLRYKIWQKMIEKKIKKDLRLSPEPRGIVFEGVYDFFSTSVPSITFLHALRSHNFQGMNLKKKTDKLFEIFEKKALEKVKSESNLVTVSSEYRHLIEKTNNFINWRLCRVLPLGINVKPYLQKRKEKKGSHLKMVYVGLLDKRKNIHFLLEVFNDLAVKNSNIQLTLVGDGPEKENLKTYVEKKGLKKRVFFLGRRPLEEIPHILLTHDIYLHPSFMESFCYSLLEASLAGLTTIANENLAVPLEFIDYPLRLDHEKWIKTIEKIIMDKKSQKNRDTLEYKRAKLSKKYSNDRMASSVLKILRK